MTSARWVLALTVFLGGCSDLFGERDPLALATDKRFYEFGTPLQLRILNVSDAPVTFGRCGGQPFPDLRIDRLTEAGWREVDGFGCAGPDIAGSSLPFVLEPGKHLDLTLVAHLAGTLRMRVGSGMEQKGKSNDYRVSAGTITILGQ